MKINKLSIIILIISIFFFGFSFIRDIERQKQTDKRNQDIIKCLTNAEEGFLGEQYKECKDLKIITGECLDIIERIFKEYNKCYEM
jgi:Na+/H+-translocating membrane pyrophosphatase